MHSRTMQNREIVSQYIEGAIVSQIPYQTQPACTYFETNHERRPSQQSHYDDAHSRPRLSPDESVHRWLLNGSEQLKNLFSRPHAPSGSSDQGCDNQAGAMQSQMSAKAQIASPMRQRCSSEESEDEGLPQAQLTISTDSKRVYDRSGEVLEESKIDEAQRTQTKRQSIPPAILDQLRAWRRESYEGRYLPRKLQLIPQDQAYILQHDDSWQPPLVGRAERPGTVPIELLNALTKQADERAANERDVRSSSTSNRSQHERNENEGTTPVSSASSAVESWSPSPSPAVRKKLPPNSPQVTGAPWHGPEPRSHDTAHGERDTQDRSPILATTREHGSKNCPHPSDQNQNGNAHVLIDLGQCKNSASSYASSSISSMIGPGYTATSVRPTSAANKMQKPQAIQVTRTPRPDVAVNSQRSANSTSVSSTMVPGTCHFEENSSEDEATRVLQRPGVFTNASVQATSQHTSDDVAIPYQTGPRGSSRPSPSIELPQQKHCYAGSQLTEQQSKRLKTHQSLSTKGEVENSYAKLDSQRRRNRRDFFHKHGSGDHTTTTSMSPRPSVANRGRVKSVSEPRAALDVPPDHICVITKSQANHEQASEGVPELRKQAQSRSNGSTSSTASRDKLFLSFKIAYPEYKGKQKHFDAAIKMLESLKVKGLALHRKLYDDFIFRRFHDYKIHLQEVMESGDDPLPYEVFYKTRVKQSDRQKMIVKPDHLSTFARESSSASPHTLSNAVQSFFSKSPLGRNDNRTEKVPMITPQSSDFSDVLSPGDRESSHGESPRSVKVWLERVPGAASPVLGTPTNQEDEPNLLSEHDMPELQMQVKLRKGQVGAQKQRNYKGSDVIVKNPVERIHRHVSDTESEPKGLAHFYSTAPARMSKRRSLPWATPDSRDETEASIPSNQVVSKFKDLVPTCFPLSITPEAMKSSTQPWERGSVKETLAEIRPERVLAQSENRVSKLSPRRERDQADHGPVETKFQRYVRSFNTLPLERTTATEQRHRVEEFIDIFSWRRDDHLTF